MLAAETIVSTDSGSAWIAAALGGALYGALIVWRGLGIAGSAASWRASAFAGLAATLALALGAFALAAKGALALLAVLGGGAAVVALSVSRGTEETFAASRSGPAKTLPGSAAAILVGFGAIVAALALPTVGALLGVAAEAVAPFVHALIVLIVTPFVYLVDALIRALLPLFRDFRLDLPRILLPRGTPIDDEETVRLLHAEAEVFLERFAIALALVLIAVLIARVVVARALVARADGPLERESVAGEGLAALLGSLFARRAAVRPARPRGDDPHSRVRRAYWDFLALAERGGGGWRAAPQTPREHLAGLSGDAWLVAGDVIAPFEESRYAERASEADADRAEQALREIERELAARA